VKRLLHISALIPLLLSCATASKPAQTTQIGYNPPRQITTSAQHITTHNIDDVLISGADYLSEKLPVHTKIAFVYMQSPTKNLSEYVIDTTIMHLVNKDKFSVIERAELPALQKEQLYQASGEVSDETAVSIGHQLGVQVIITGSLMEAGSRYSLRLKAIDVETAQILGTRIYPVERDQTLAALLMPPPQTTKVPVKEEQPKQTVIQGDVNITTNNNTTINGDVYVNKPDWFNKDLFFE
jgi:curli biogenesis system outer membrane secretion channel CsgG